MVWQLFFESPSLHIFISWGYYLANNLHSNPVIDGLVQDYDKMFPWNMVKLKAKSVEAFAKHDVYYKST